MLPIEREDQNVAKLMHNRFFAGSTVGAPRMATLLEIVATGRSLSHEANAYIVWASTRLDTHRDGVAFTAAGATPAAYPHELHGS